jgi:presenilin-like A22 family membrane protease/membrane protein implicated in regulation of membrane protease activity
MDLLQLLWGWLADPNVAYLLLVGGILAAVTAWSIPGTGLAEGLAALLLGLAIIGLLQLPVSAASLLLILLGSLLLLGEIYFQSGGYLGLSGAIALGLGGLFLLPPGAEQRVAPAILVGTTLAGAAASFGLAHLMRQMVRRPPLRSLERLIGAEGIAQTDLDPEGTVWVRGETWTARAVAERIAAGERIRVLTVQGLRLQVTRVAPPPEASEPSADAPDPALGSVGPAGVGGAMAILLSVHFLAFLGSGFPLTSRTPAPSEALEALRQLSGQLGARPIGEQVAFAVPFALIPIAVGALFALLLRLRDRMLLSRILSFALLAAFGAALFFALHRLLSALLWASPPAWADLMLGGLTVVLLREERRRSSWALSSLMGLLACSGAVIYLGYLLPPLAAVALLLIMILYDALAVHVVGHMQRLARWALEEQLPMLFVIPLGIPRAKTQGPILVIGFGDAILPAVLTLSALREHPVPWPAIGTLIGILAGQLLLTARLSAQRRVQAGLPFLAGGALLGYGLGRLLMQAGGFG